jgi:hypothetical protein
MSMFYIQRVKSDFGYLQCIKTPVYAAWFRWLDRLVKGTGFQKRVGRRLKDKHEDEPDESTVS